MNNRISSLLLTALVLLKLCLVADELAALDKVLTPPDSNTGITVENAVSLDGETQVFFLTWPNLGDPNSGKDCGLNYYRVPVQAGEAVAVAREVCSGLIQKSRLLDDGQALIVAGRQLELWKDGQKLREYPFKALPALSRQGIVNDLGGPDHLGISSTGHVVAAVVGAQDRLDIVSLSPEGEEAWRRSVRLEGAVPVSLSIDAAADGGALLIVTMAGLSTENTVLHVFDRSGEDRAIDLTRNGDALQPGDLENMSPEELQSVFRDMANADPAAVKQIGGMVRPDGGYDVLYQLQGGNEAAEGLYLLRLTPLGEEESEHYLGPVLQEIGLKEWVDFVVSGNELWLSGRVVVFQPGVEATRDRYMQNVVSRIDLDSGRVDSRLVPLDQRYLEAAMNAGDAEIKNLPGLPGGMPVLLTSSEGRPVDVAVGTVAKAFGPAYQRSRRRPGGLEPGYRQAPPGRTGSEKSAQPEGADGTDGTTHAGHD